MTPKLDHEESIPKVSNIGFNYHVWCLFLHLCVKIHCIYVKQIENRYQF